MWNEHKPAEMFHLYFKLDNAGHTHRKGDSHSRISKAQSEFDVTCCSNNAVKLIVNYFLVRATCAKSSFIHLGNEEGCHADHADHQDHHDEKSHCQKNHSPPLVDVEPTMEETHANIYNNFT